MRTFLRSWLGCLVGLSAFAVVLSGCGPVQTIGKEDGDRYRHPPRQPPPQYKGNQLGGPPPAAGQAGGR